MLPFFGTLIALGLLFYRPIGAVEISLFFSMWLLTGLGMTVGYHRLFTHRAFSTSPVMSCVLIGMGSIILNGAKIGAGSIIAAGTLIPEKTVVEPGSLWMGSPGKFRRKLEAGEDEMIMRYARNYLGYTEEYLRER